MKTKFLSYPIPSEIGEEWEKITSIGNKKLIKIGNNKMNNHT